MRMHIIAGFIGLGTMLVPTTVLAQNLNLNPRYTPREQTDSERLQNFRPPPPPAPSRGMADRARDSVTYTSPGGTTVSPYAGGRDRNVYDNPRDRSGTVGVEIRHR